MVGSRRTLGYISFILFVGFMLLARGPRAELVTIDFSSLSVSFGELLIGLGGFSITVLAVLLGLEALDDQLRDAAHLSAVRHVAVSLSIASIACFVSASLLGEVNAQGAALEAKKELIRSQIDERLLVAGLDEKGIAAVKMQMNRDIKGHVDVEPLRPALAATGVDAEWFDEADQLLNGTVRRHFLLASVSGFAATLLILQSLALLLLIRFPNSERVAAMHMLAVLGISAILFIKLMHTFGYGQSLQEYLWGRIAVLAGMALLAAWFAWYLRKSIRIIDDKAIATYTPLMPYYVVLSASLVSMFFLAATFGDFGVPNLIDRVITGMGLTIPTAFLLVMQIEQPTVELLRQNAVQDLT